MSEMVREPQRGGMRAGGWLSRASLLLNVSTGRAVAFTSAGPPALPGTLLGGTATATAAPRQSSTRAWPGCVSRGPFPARSSAGSGAVLAAGAKCRRSCGCPSGRAAQSPAVLKQESYLKWLRL